MGILMSFEVIKPRRLAGRWAGALLGLAAVLAPALGDDRPFITLYTVDLTPAGETEFEQSLGWFSGHAGESFNAVTAQSEIEHGFSGNFQGALYLTYDWSRTRVAGGPAEAADFIGTKAEFIYRILSPYSDPIGLGIYFEPFINPAERGLETKILLQKNFLDDRLRAVINVNFEDVWAKNDLGNFDKESALEFRAGATYALTPHWSLGLEFANERGFDGLILGGSASETEDAYYLGPVIQYAASPFLMVIGAQAQLPIASNPTHAADAVVDGFAAEAERFRVGARFAWEL